MPRGAAPGERRGGRRKGTPNRKTQEQIDAIRASGLTPLEYLLSVMRDENATRAERLDAAAKAAPFVHPRLTSSEVSLDADIRRRPPEQLSDDELMAIASGGFDESREIAGGGADAIC